MSGPIKCQKCGSLRVHIYSENQSDTANLYAEIRCSDCGQILNDPRAVQILREV
jgi:ribosomal protein S27E